MYCCESAKRKRTAECTRPHNSRRTCSRCRKLRESRGVVRPGPGGRQCGVLYKHSDN